MTRGVEARETVDLDEPLRLADAVALAYPRGGMTVSGLRRERDRGNLAIERVAGREFTTLRAIQEMRRRCLVQPRERASTSSGMPAAQPTGSSETASIRKEQDALKQTLQELKQGLRSTSGRSGGREGRVIPLKSA